MRAWLMAFVMGLALAVVGVLGLTLRIRLPRPLSVALLLCALILTGVGLRGCRPAPLPPADVPRDTMDASAYRGRITALEAMIGAQTKREAGLRGALRSAEQRIRGLEARTPERITVYDTVVDVRTLPVIRYVQVDGAGHATVDALLPDSAGHRPETHHDIDVSDCDDGFAMSAQGTICNRATLGHLTVFVRAGAAYGPVIEPLATAGLSWQPSFRSSLRVEAGADIQRRGYIAIQTGIRIF